MIDARTRTTHGRRLAAAIGTLAALASLSAHASAAPFSGGDMLAILAFAVDLAIGPLSLVVLAIVCAARIGWRPWLAVLAVVNVLIAGVLVLFDDGGLGSLVALAWVQLALAIAVLVLGTRPAWRTAVFGARAD
jgi:hypothetical protein